MNLKPNIQKKLRRERPTLRQTFPKMRVFGNAEVGSLGITETFGETQVVQTQRDKDFRGLMQVKKKMQFKPGTI